MESIVFVVNVAWDSLVMGREVEPSDVRGPT